MSTRASRALSLRSTRLNGVRSVMSRGDPSPRSQRRLNREPIAHNSYGVNLLVGSSRLSLILRRHSPRIEEEPYRIPPSFSRLSREVKVTPSKRTKKIVTLEHTSSNTSLISLVICGRLKLPAGPTRTHTSNITLRLKNIRYSAF